MRIRLIEIGEAVKNVPPDLLAHEPGLPWQEIARMRDHLAHRYFALPRLLQEVSPHSRDRRQQ